MTKFWKLKLVRNVTFATVLGIAALARDAQADHGNSCMDQWYLCHLSGGQLFTSEGPAYCVGSGYAAYDYACMAEILPGIPYPIDSGTCVTWEPCTVGCDQPFCNA
jgi:hypothetical protein